jgi:hypothetical protein
MSTSATESPGWAAIDRMAEAMAKARAKQPLPDSTRESDGSTQLVPYPGWLLIATRIARKK